MSSDWEAATPIPFDELWRVAPTVRIEYNVGSMTKPHARLSMPATREKEIGLVSAPTIRNVGDPDNREYLWCVRVEGGGCRFIRFGDNDPSALAAFIGAEFGCDLREGWT